MVKKHMVSTSDGPIPTWLQMRRYPGRRSGAATESYDGAPGTVQQIFFCDLMGFHGGLMVINGGLISGKTYKKLWKITIFVLENSP